MRTLSSRERKGVALLLLVAVIALLQMLVIAPVIDGFTERAERRAMLLQRYQTDQRLVASIPRLRHMAEQQQSQLQFFTLAAPTPGAANTLLEQRLLKAIEAAGGELRNSEEVTDKPGYAAMRLSCRITLAQLAMLLKALQDVPPYLSIDALSVNADQAAISRKLEPLDVSLEVSIPLGRPAPR